MRLSGWLSTVLRKVRRGKKNRRSDRLYDQADLRLYVTQLEERRVLSASPVGHAVMDFTHDGALSASRSEASSLSFEHTSVPMDNAMPSSPYGGRSVIQDHHSSGNKTIYDGLMTPLSLETEPSVHVSITDGTLTVRVADQTPSSQILLQLVQEDGTEYLQISDPTNSLVAESGAIWVDNHTLRVVMADLTGGIQVIGGSGDDTLTIDLSSGNPITTAGFLFDAGDGHDNVKLQANGEDVAFFLGRTAGEGAMAVGGGTIRFTGVEPNTVTLTEAATVTLNLSEGDEVTFSAVSESRSRAEGLSNAVEFDNPTTQLLVNVLDDSDYALDFDGLAADFNPSEGLAINGGSGAEAVTIRNLGNSFSAALAIDLGIGADSVTFDGAGTSNLHYASLTLRAPTIQQINGATLTVSGATILDNQGAASTLALDHAENDFDSIQVIAPNASVKLRDKNSLEIVAVTAGGTLDIASTDLRITGPVMTAGDLVLSALGGDLTIKAATTSASGPIRLDATRDIVIQALVHSGANILLLADSDNDGQGGLWVQASGKVAAGGDIVGQGSNLGLGDGIRVDADNHHADADQMVADGNITLSTKTDLVLRGVIRTTESGFIDLDPLGNIQLGTTLATRGGRIRVPRPTVLIGDTQLTTNATRELTDNNETQAPSLGGDISWVAGATIDSQVGQSHNLNVSSGTGTTTFNANIGQTTALASLVVANTTGRVTFGGADLAAGDLAPVTLVRTYGDIDVGAGALDADEVSGGIVLSGGSQPDSTLTFRTLDEGNVRFNGPVTLSSDVVVTTNGDGDTGTGGAQAGDITFTDAATVDSQMGEHNDLVLRAGTGTIQFGANVGQTVSLQSLTVQDTTGGVIFGTADAVAVDSETGPVTLVRTEGDLILGAGPSDPGVSGQIVFNGGASADGLLVHTLHGAIRIRGNATLESTTTFQHTGEASLSISGGTLNILDPNSQLVIDALTDPLADAPTDSHPTAVIDSQINGAGRLVKTGAGWLTLTNPDNSYGGGTTIAGGTLSISKDGHLGSAPDTPVPDSILIDGATLYVRSDVPADQLPYAFWLDGHRGISLGTASGAGYGEIFVQRDVMMMYSGVVADNDAAAGSLHKTGPGILMLNGLNTHTGTTYIMAGRLLINGSTSPASTVYVGGQRTEDGVWIGGEPIRVTEQYAMLGGVGVVQGNVYVLGMPEVGAEWVLEPPGGHINPGSILDQAEWITTTKPDGTVVETWGLPTVPGILTVGPIEFLPNSYLNIDFGNGGEVDPATGWGKAPGFPYPGGSAAWAAAFADWQSQAGPQRGLPPVDRTGYDQLRMMDDLVLNAAILNPNLQYMPLAWEARFLIADFDGDGQVTGSLFQERTFTIDGEDYVVRYDRGPNDRSISFEAAGFTPVFRGLPTPEAPALFVARDPEAIAPPALRSYQDPPLPPIANLAAASEVAVGSERFVEVRVVTPIDDAGGVRETVVLRLPPEVLRDLRGLVNALPDDRYRVYLVIEHGQGRSSEEFLVRELYVREGKPVDRDPQQPQPPIPTAEETSGESPAEPSDDEEQGATEQHGPSQDGRMSIGAIAVGSALWQARVDRAIAKYAKRVPNKAIRLCRANVQERKGRANEVS